MTRSWRRSRSSSASARTRRRKLSRRCSPTSSTRRLRPASCRTTTSSTGRSAACTSWTVCARASRVLLGGLLLLACVACGGGDRGGDEFAIYHLEAAIGPPGTAGELRCGPPRAECPGVLQQPPQHDYHYAVRKAPSLTGDDILRDSVRTIPGTAAGEELVTRRAHVGRSSRLRPPDEGGRAHGRARPGLASPRRRRGRRDRRVPGDRLRRLPGRDPERAGDPVPRRERGRRRRPGRAASGRLAGPPEAAPSGVFAR